MKAFILTRFNVKYRWLNPQRQEAIEGSWDQWLRTRAEIFERWTLPSFLQQEYLDTHFIVLFDSRRTPDWLRERIECWKGMSERFVPIFIEQDYLRGCSARAVRSWLKKNGPGRGVAVTFWVDSDDIISPYYVARAMAAANPKKTAMCFPTGYRITLGALSRGQLMISDRCLVAEGPWCRLTTQPMVSSMQVLVETYNSETLDSLETVHWRPHPDVHKEMPVVDLCPGEPHFVKIVHEDAIMNRRGTWFGD